LKLRAADGKVRLTDSVNLSDYKKMKKRDPKLAKGWRQIVSHPADAP